MDEMNGTVVVGVAAPEATVEAIGYQKRTVTLKGPEGNLANSRVYKSVKRFVVVAAQIV